MGGPTGSSGEPPFPNAGPEVRRTWGATREEALRKIQEVAQMVVEDMIEDGEALPESAVVSDEPAVAVNVA